MRRRDHLSAIVGLLAGALPEGLRAAAAPKGQPSIQDAVKAELAAANADGRILALYFHASWCAYCKLFEIFFKDPAAAKIFNAHFRLAPYRVREEKAKYKAQELPGAKDYFLSFTGGNIAVPLLVFLGPDGKTRSTSINERGKNIGYPVAGWELDWFETMLAKAALDMSAKDINTLRDVCVRIYKG